MVERAIRGILTVKNLTEQNKKLYKYALGQLLSNEDLFQVFLRKCKIDSSESDLEAEEHDYFLYEKLTRLFFVCICSTVQEGLFESIEAGKG